MNKARDCHEVAGLEGRVVVDGFRLKSDRIEAFFLSHFHGDHYDGLSEKFAGPAPILCTHTTARLVAQELGVDASLLRGHAYGETVQVCGAHVTFLDANHCPGAALLLFRLEDGRVHLHTGDMRYHPRMETYPKLLEVRGQIDRLYLDTTYCHPKHSFVAQDDSVEAIAAAVYSRLEPINSGKPETSANQVVAKDESGTQCLILLSAYKIGKERVMLAVARRTGELICVDERKMAVLRCLDLPPDDLAVFTTDPDRTPIHVIRMGVAGEMWPYFQPNFASLGRYLSQHPRYARVAAFIPTGWADGSKYNREHAEQSSGACSVVCVPYSEHSNFEELRAFVSFLKPREVVPTVFSDARSRRQMAARFAALVDGKANKRAFLSLISSSGPKLSTRATGQDQTTCGTAEDRDSRCDAGQEKARRLLITQVRENSIRGSKAEERRRDTEGDIIDLTDEDHNEQQLAEEIERTHADRGASSAVPILADGADVTLVEDESDGSGVGGGTIPRSRKEKRAGGCARGVQGSAQAILTAYFSPQKGDRG